MIPQKRKPTHPGRILLKHFLEELPMSQKELLEHINKNNKNWTYAKINEIINEKRGITPETALVFSDVFGTTPHFWLNLQQSLDLFLAKANHKTIKKIKSA